MGKYTHQETLELFQRVSEGDIEARNLLVEDNIPLVISFIKKKNFHKGSLCLQDLINEGCIGLIKAVEDFDYESTYEFSTYAAYWIKNSIMRLLSRNSLSFKVNLEVFKLARKAISIGIPANIEEIREKFQCTQKGAKKIIACMQASVEDDDFSTIAAKTEEIIVDIPIFLDRLTPREQQILKMRYGLAPYREMNFTEISVVLKVSKQNVQKTHDKAIQKINEDFGDVR